MDELDTLPHKKAEEVWNRVIARQRQKSPHNPDAPNRCSVYSTPEGFRFTYHKWGRNPTPQYQYVRADTRTNTHLPEDYVDSLFESYPDHLAEAYVSGRWVNLTQGGVYYAFDRKSHDCDAVPHANETLHVGIDFNVYHMAATILVERGLKSYAVDEIAGVEDTPQLINILKERYHGHRIMVYPDATGARRDTRSRASDHALLRKAGFSVRSYRRNQTFQGRALSVNVRFLDEYLYVNCARCPSLAEGLEHQVYNDSGEPDKTQNLDHAPDSLGYYVVFRFPVLRNQLVEKEVV